MPPKPTRYLPSRTGIFFLTAALLAVCYLYFVHAGGGWNVMTRLALIRSIVHDHRLELRPSAAARTGDKAEYPPGSGHYYCDKPIGAQLVGLPAYAVAFWLFRFFTPRLAVALSAGAVAATWTVSGVSSIVLGLVFFTLAGYFTDRYTVRLAATLLYCLGTLAWPYATVFFGHQLAAATGFCALAAAYVACASPLRGTLWSIAAGSLAGLAVVTEFPATMIYAAVAIFLAQNAGYRRLIAYLCASFPFVALQLAYNWACFDYPLRFGYQYEVNPEFARPEGWVSWPRPSVAGALLFSRDKGLLVFSPYLVFAAAGLFFAIRSNGVKRRLAWTCLVIFAAYFLYNCGHYMWWGGSCLGPRHLVPALPFLAFGLVFLPPHLAPVWRVALGASGAWSVAVNWLGAATVSEPGPAIANSHVLEAGLSQLLSGGLDWPNLGLLTGLVGSLSLLPQVLVGGALAVTLVILTRAMDRPPHSPS